MSKKASVIIYSVLGAVIIALGILLAVSTASNASTIVGLGQINDDLEYQKSILASQKESLEFQLSELQDKLAEVEVKFENAGEVYADEIGALKLEIENKLTQIAELEADIAKYQTVFTIDVRAQAKLIEQIEEYITTQYPCVRMLAPEPESEGTEVSDSNEDSDEPEYIWVSVKTLIDEELAMRAELGEDAEPLFTEEELAASAMTEEELTKLKLRDKVLAREDVVLPSVSIYYEDLATGYHYGYNENVPYNSASVIKAPYILSVLRAVAADEKAYFDALATEGKSPEYIDTDEDSTPDTLVIEYSDPLYNLSDVVVYDSKTMMKDGSGKIKDMPDGTELTYIDFVKYALEESDNIAYQQLKNRFGYSRYYALAREVKANSVLANAVNMTAADAGKLFKAIYEFVEEDNAYSKIMYDSMATGNHTVIIPHGVYPTKTLHKYGWDVDSYHDAAIVLHGDKPYILTVFSDFDEGGAEVNAYLQGIVRLINKLHKGFYQS